MSMEKIELELLYWEVKDDMRAANMAANITPFIPKNKGEKLEEVVVVVWQC